MTLGTFALGGSCSQAAGRRLGGAEPAFRSADPVRRPGAGRTVFAARSREAFLVVPDVVHQLVASERALDKLAARSISSDEPTQLRHNRYVIVRNPRDPGRRRFLIDSTDGGRVLTLVIEQTLDPTTLMVVVHGEDASRLARIAQARGQKPSEVLAELLRDADRPAA